MSNSQQIIFIDSAIFDKKTLIDSLPADSIYYILDANSDGLQQIADILSEYTDLAAIQIISHGTSGSLQLGNSQINQANLTDYSAELATIGNALSVTGDILLYGCNVAQGETGLAFIQALATATGADVAASTDLTGNAALGGNWQLEAAIGTIETTPQTFAYEGVLGLTVRSNTKLFPGHTLGEFRNWSAFAAIKADGSVITWGSEAEGGDSTVYHYDNTYIQDYSVVSQLDGMVNVTQIFSTNSAFAALRVDGSVVTWGRGEYGGDSSAVAIALNGADDNKDVVQIFSTEYAFAALRVDGSVVTWGAGEYGGDSAVYHYDNNTSTNIKDYSVANQLDGTVNVRQIFSTGGAFAALRVDGSVVTWGRSNWGADSSAVAIALDGTDNSKDVVQIFSNDFAFAALRADGSVVTWGSGGNGGDSNAVATELNGTDNSKDVVQIFSTAYDSFAALRADGSVVTWGSARYGDTDSYVYHYDNNTVIKDYSVASQLDGTVDVTQIFSTEYAFAALRVDGSVVTWGRSDYGADSAVYQYDNNTYTYIKDYSVASQLDGTVDVTQISSTDSAFAALRADGSVITWGRSQYGGDSSAVAIALDGTDNSKDVIQIFSTNGAFASLRTDGSVVSWGSSWAVDSSAVATALDGTDNSKDVVHIFSTGAAFSALCADGSVFTWGDSSYGGDSSVVADKLSSGVVGFADIYNDYVPSAEQIFNSTGYYRFFAMLSSAVYLHTGIGDEGVPTEHRAFELDNYQKVVASGFHFLTAEELGIAPTGYSNDVWLDNSNPLDLSSPLEQCNVPYNYDFKNGFYGTDALASPAASFACVGATKDALFITFRGTDQTWDWITDGFGMHQQYAMYGALTRAIDAYLTNNLGTKVYVSGHSLGGQMATLYMSEHFNDPNFIAVEFEAANKLWTDNQGNDLPNYNPNIVNVEMPWDPVPDLGVNRGDVIQVDFPHGIIPATNHPMSEVFKYISEIDKQVRNPTANVDLPLEKLADNNPINVMIETQKVFYFAGADLTGNDTVIIKGSDGEIYRPFDNLTLKNPIVKNIIIEDDAITPSENVNYYADSTDTNGKVIVGNAGNNVLVGGAGNDVLIGGADKDLLVGGLGDDVLIGGKYDALSLSYNQERLPLEVRGFIDTYADALAPDNQDVSYLMGGLGKDEMYGSRFDNDYFLIDVSLVSSTSNKYNVDTINDFYMANFASDFTSADYLVFSGEQLGIDIYTIDSNPLDYPDVLGSNNATYLSALNFQVEDAITSGMSYGLAANEATFILSKEDNGLYFDKDGVNLAYSPTLLAHINPASYGWSTDLSTFDADQILLVSSFKDMQFLSVTFDSISPKPNVAPVLITPVTINYIDTAFIDNFATKTGTLVGSDADTGTVLTYGITGGINNGNGTVSKSNAYGTLTVTVATGAYSFVANGATIEPLSINVSDASLSVTVSDGSLSDSKTFTIAIAQSGITESTGNDTLTGTTGVDHFAGLAGSDNYTVNNTTDVVTEKPNEGIDSVFSAVSYTLSANVENLILTGTANIFAMGNAEDNILVGNSGNNVMNGGAGKDTLFGLGGADTMTGGINDDIYSVDNGGDIVKENAGEGLDTVYSNLFSYVLTANVENLVLTGVAIYGYGNVLNNQLTGNTANNTLDGKIGADTMIGGAGDDTYVVDDSGDVVTEQAGGGIDTVRSSISYILKANAENLVLTGTAKIFGMGNTDNNILTGNSSDNMLDGQDGIDTMKGGLGNDTYYVDNAMDVVIEVNIAGSKDVVYSTVSYTLSNYVYGLRLDAGITAIGNASNNKLVGNAGDNVLDGKAGADTLVGGAGDDIYTIDNLGDVVTENSNEGNDTIYASVNIYTALKPLAANVETLVLTGTATTGYGNDLDNELMGNLLNNTLNGGLGVDNMLGRAGNDTYYVDNAADVVTEIAGEGTDTVYSSATYTLTHDIENLMLIGTAAIDATGNAGNNILIGNASSNILDGKSGADTMKGGLGNDVYYVDDTGDVVTEGYVLNSRDMVYATVSYTLSNYVYGLTLDAGISAIGNASNNTLVGNAGDNILDGKAGVDTMIGGTGADTYYVDNAGDVVTENANEGFDTIFSSVNILAPKPLAANVEALVLTGAATIGYGNGLDNALTGNALNNTLDGGAGVDTMKGGAGNDTYYVDDTADVVTENAGEGTSDSVYSSATYILTANIERLTLTGTADINATGNTSDNILTGNTGNNVLSGGEGADTLMGGLGQDTYNLIETTAATDIVRVAKGDSLVASHDSVNNFSLGVGGSTAGVDKLDLASTLIAANVAAKDGFDAGIILSHHIDKGIISFDDANAYDASSHLTITGTDLPDVFSYLQANVLGGNTVAFVSEGNTYVFQDGGTVDTLVELVGVSATSLSTTGLAAGSVWIM